MMKKLLLSVCFLWYLTAHAQSGQVLTVNQMHKDLAILKAAYTQLHPGVYRYTTPVQLDQYFEEIMHITAQPLPLTQFYISLSQLSVKLHCGHTYVNPYNQKKTIVKQVFADRVMPILFQTINDEFIITHNLSENISLKKGDEIVSINGIGTKEIIDSLLTVSRADGMHGRNKQLDNISISPYFADAKQYALFDIYFPLFFSNPGQDNAYQLIIKPFRGEKKLVKIPAVSKLTRQTVFKQRYLAEYAQPTATFNWFTERCGYLKIEQFSQQGWKSAYKQYLDSTFNVLRTHQASTLIVDIRNNEGGDDEVRNEVLSYLLERPFSYPIKRYYRFLSVRDSLLPYLDTWDESFKKPKTATDYIKNNDGLFYKKNIHPADTIQPKANHFEGQIYLLTAAINSSSSFFMADILQQAKAAVLIGETTGGTKQGINGGQFFFLKLPNTGIEIDIPIVYQAPLMSRTDEGIVPDIKIKTRQKDIATGNDPVVNYIRKRLK